MQALAVTYQDSTGSFTAADTARTPDILNLAGSVARSCPLLRLLSLSAIAGFQDRVRAENGCRMLPSLSALTRLSSLRLWNCGVCHWPSPLGALTALRQLLVADWEFEEEHAYLVEGPMPHDLASLQQLHTLDAAAFSWQAALPASLTALVLTCHRRPWMQAQFPDLLRQLAHMPRLASLAMLNAEWLQAQLPSLVSALCGCRSLSSLLLKGCGVTSLPADLSGFAGLPVLEICNFKQASDPPSQPQWPQLTQLTACTRLDLRLCPLEDAAAIAMQVSA